MIQRSEAPAEGLFINRRTRLLLVFGLLASAPVPAATICCARLDSLDSWSLHAHGAATAHVVTDPLPGRCLELTSAGGSVLLSRELPLASVRGCRVSVSCLVRTLDVTRGPQLVSTAKLHLAVQTPGGIQHTSARFTGTRAWQREGFTADVPADARRAVLNIGLEACSGRMGLANLLVRNDQRGVHPLRLHAVANAKHGQLGLPALPPGRLLWNDIPFDILDAADNGSGDCVRLAGVGHEDWPRATAAPVAAPAGATTIYILHGALGGPAQGETPCVIWTARYQSGQEASLSVFPGREIGGIGQPDSLPNWHVAWRGADGGGRPRTFGVTRWTLASDAPLESVSCRAYRGPPVVVLALTAVEEPPRQPERGRESEDDEIPGEGGE